MFIVLESSHATNSIAREAMTSHRRDAETRRTAEIMRKLKLQMQITVDGFVAGPNGELDWMNANLEMEDDKLLPYINSLIVIGHHSNG
jgi:uncharacterized alpha/beta hydrolase family protein